MTLPPGVEMLAVKSSNVEAYGYQADAAVLFVRFTSGDTYAYRDVSPELFATLESAQSKGRHLRKHIIERPWVAPATKLQRPS